MRRALPALCWLLTTVLVAGCAALRPGGGGLRLHELRRLSGFKVPESVLPDVGTGTLYVSNIEAVPGEYWSDDGHGFVTRIEADGRRSDRWLDSAPGAVLNAPKGLCLLQGRLYLADNHRLLSCDAATGGGLTVVAVGFGDVNDLATDGSSIWLSDSAEAAGGVWCLAPDGSSRRQVPAPTRPNGLAFHQGRLFVVSWDAHDVFELDPQGVLPPRPFGQGRHFTNLDGLVVLDDGTFIVSDFNGNQVCAISPDRKDVRGLARVTSPADIGLDRPRGLLYVPLFNQDEVVVFSWR